MESPQKKRSLFGALNFFGRSATIPTESDGAKADPQNKGDSTLPSTFGDASFESPAKSASLTQMQGRKLRDRPQGPSSKLAQALSTKDLMRLDSMTPSNSTNFANMTAGKGMLKRMPGDNPNKFATVTGSTFRPTSSLLGTATAARSMARPSTPRRPGIPFSPRIPAQTMRGSFPPTSTAKAASSSAAGVNTKNWNNGEPQELFNMRIPSPPRNLTGELLSREVPKNHGRPGSVYADEFLAHYCPPDFNDVERRQFFCILDLRRLKYVADEVFTSKDWKINISNFAAEYNKSRSLIMLRYGLYEFKTIRASESVKKEWMAKHGIVTSDDEGDMAGVVKPTVGSKRKAEDQLTPNDNVLAESSQITNKRARGAESVPLKKTDVMASSPNKRRAPSVESDDNRPTKLQKKPSAPSPPKITSSATKSMFEKIANNKTVSRNSSAETPSKSSPFAPQSKDSNGTFGPGAKAAAPKNIFGHLPEESKDSANDDADADSGEDTDSGGEAEESRVDESGPSTALVNQQDVAPLGGNPAQTNGTSSMASSDSGEGTKPRSIFERLSYGNDGQPIRKPTPQPTTPLVEEKSTSPAKVAPADQTWSTAAPIKFAPPALQGNSLLSSSTSKPDSGSALFGAGSARKAEDATEVSEDITKSVFSATPSSTHKPAANGASIFGSATTPATTASKLFGSTARAFGEAENQGSSKPAASTPAPLFGAKPPTSTGDTPSKHATSNPTPLAGAMPPTSTEGVPNSSVFGTQTSAPTIFTNTAKPTEEKGQPPFGAPSPGASQETPKSMFGETPKPSFGETSKPLFGETPKPSFGEASKPSFGEPLKPTFAAPGTPSIFGSRPKTDGAGDKSSAFSSSTLFGAKTEDPKESGTAKLFGAAKPFENASPLVPTSASIFANKTASQAGGLFGAATTSDTSTPKPSFGTPSRQSAGNIFGAVPANGIGDQEPPAKKSSFAASSNTGSNNMFGFSASKPTSSAAGIEKPSSGLGSRPFGQTETTQAPSIFANGGKGDAGSAGGSFQFGQPSVTASLPTASNSFAFGSNKGGSGVAATFSTNSISFDFGAGSSAPTASGQSSFTFGGGAPSTQSTSQPFSFAGNQATATPNVSFGVTSGPSTPTPGPMFGATGTSETAATPNMFGGFGGSQQAGLAGNMFGVGGLAPAGGTSTGTNTPFTFGGASSLATTPAAGTPEPGGELEDQGKEADGDDAQQGQISLTDQGLGEEDEVVVHEVRTKAVKLMVARVGSDDSSGKDKQSTWKVQGVGPLRILKHKTTGAVRLLLRADPSGNVTLNKSILPDFNYEPESEGSKYVKLTTASNDGKGLETWMLQVKTPLLAKELAEALQANKGAKK